jgi:hypothetical protein
MTADHVNGLFEMVGSVAIWLHVRRLMIDKQVRGASWGATAFFMAWGYWNLYYYPHLGQWASFVGGCSIVVANTAWLVLMLYYIAREENAHGGNDPFGSPRPTLAEGCRLYEESLRPLPTEVDETPFRAPGMGVPELPGGEVPCLS